MTRSRLPPGLLAGILIVLLTPGAASASIGVGVGAGPIALASPAQPGHSYPLPALYVVNTGTVTSSYRLSVERLSGGPELTAPPAWVHFTRNDITLAPKRSAFVKMTLAVPADAAAGSYLSDIVAGTVARPDHPGGAAAGARAAAELTFQIGAGQSGLPWPWPWWSYALLGGAAALGFSMWAQRRYGIRLRVERRH